MKTKTIGSLIVLLAVATTMAAVAPSAFAEHSMNAVVENAAGSSTPGCEPDCFPSSNSNNRCWRRMVEFVQTTTMQHTHQLQELLLMVQAVHGTVQFSHDGYESIQLYSCTRSR